MNSLSLVSHNPIFRLTQHPKNYYAIIVAAYDAAIEATTATHTPTLPPTTPTVTAPFSTSAMAAFIPFDLDLS